MAAMGAQADAIASWGVVPETNRYGQLKIYYPPHQFLVIYLQAEHVATIIASHIQQSTDIQADDFVAGQVKLAVGSDVARHRRFQRKTDIIPKCWFRYRTFVST